MRIKLPESSKSRVIFGMVYKREKEKNTYVIALKKENV